MSSEEYEPSDKYFGHFLSFSFVSGGHGLIILTLFFVLIILLIAILLLQFFFHKAITSTSTTTTHNVSTSITTNTVAVPAITIGLDAATINSIPIFLHGSLSTGTIIDEERDHDECSICLGLFEDDEMVKVLPDCLHAYHPHCVDKWLKNRSSCPLCRLSLDSTTTSTNKSNTNIGEPSRYGGGPLRSSSI